MQFEDPKYGLPEAYHSSLATVVKGSISTSCLDTGYGE